jgi:hypothetical protein
VKRLSEVAEKLRNICRGKLNKNNQKVPEKAGVTSVGRKENTG